MVKLQKFIEQHYNTEVEEINISPASAGIWAEINKDEISARGRILDLSAYTQLKKIKIDASGLVSGIKELTLHNPELIGLVILNNNELEKLNITGCFNLKALQLNENQVNNLPYIFEYSLTRITGWEDTELYSEEDKGKLQEILDNRLRTKGESSWEREDDFTTSESSDEDQKNANDEALEELVEIPSEK